MDSVETMVEFKFLHHKSDSNQGYDYTAIIVSSIFGYWDKILNSEIIIWE